MNESNMELKNDVPITKFDDDKLDRQKFAIQIRTIIKNYKNDECLTLGIMGSWGSGKTSLINMIVDQAEGNVLNKKEFKVMRFNPWNFSKQQDLYLQFFEQLKEILISNENDEGKRKHVKNIINKYWEKIRYNGTLSLSCSGISYSKPLGEKTLETHKKEITKTLKFLRYKIIIIIDDIDRLTDDEIQQIFILVKALADFPNIIYVLPFDRNIILNSMGDLQREYGEEFLDKIIQLRIDLPKIPKTKVKNIFKKELDDLFQKEDLKLDSRRSLWYTTSFLMTIRDVNRYINNLIFYLPLMKGEVNNVDYILLTGLQLFENKIYHEIKNNKTFFTENLIKKPDNQTLHEYQKFYLDILNKKERLSEETLKEILRHLFPQMNNFDVNYSLSNQTSEWNSQLRICSNSMFDKYFELTLGETEMSNIFFERIIQSEDYDFIKKEVLKNDTEGKSEHFLEKLRDNSGKINTRNVKLFFRLLYDIGDNLDVETDSILFSKNTLLLQNIGSLSRRLNDLELYDAMKYGIKNAEEGLYLLVNDLAIHNQINQRHRFKNQKTTSKKRLTDSQLDELEKEACIKIKKWADTDNLFTVFRAIEVLYEWYFWDKKEFNNFIEKTINDDEKLIELIVVFIISAKKEANKLKCKFQLDIMEEICPIENIFDRIKTLSSKVIDGSDEKMVCESFMEEYGDFIENTKFRKENSEM